MKNRRSSPIDSQTSFAAWLAEAEKRTNQTGGQGPHPLQPPVRRKKSLPHLLLGGVLLLQLMVVVAILVLLLPLDRASGPMAVTVPPATEPLKTRSVWPVPTVAPTNTPHMVEKPVTPLPPVEPAEPTVSPGPHRPQPTATPLPLPPVLSFRGVEITQGIQVFNEPEHPRCSPDPEQPDHVFCNNSVPLVAGRHTLVRVYPACDGTCPPTDITVQLRLLKDGQEQATLSRTLTAETLRRIHNLPLGELRYKLANSLNFEFLPPPLWMTGPITFEIKAVPADPLQAAVARLSLTGNFQPRKPLRVAYLPIQSQEFTPPEPAGVDYWLLRMYPVSAVEYYRLPVPNLVLEEEVSKASLLNKLLFTYWLYARYQPVAEWPDQLFGWLPQELYNGGVSDPFWCPNCAGPHSSRVAFGGLRPEVDIGGPRILVHEIAHNLGALHAWSPTQREDPGCFKTEGTDIRVDPDWPYSQTPNIQEFGVDLYSDPPVIYPPSVYDMMAYCTQPWISPHTYRKLFDSPFLQPDANAATLPLAEFQPQAEATGSDTLLVSGVVYPDGTVSQPEIIRLEGNAFTGHGPAFSPPPGDDYCLTVEAGSKETLARRCFNVGFVDIETGQLTEASPYFFSLPQAAGEEVTQISISRNDTPLMVVLPSNSPPDVAVTFPNGGNVLTGRTTVTWEGHDADGDSLRYDLLYSADGGQSWLPLAVQLTQTEYTFDIGQIPASTNGLMRVIASDGFHTSRDSSNAPFTVRPLSQNSLSLQGPAAVQPGQRFAVTVVTNQIAEPGLFGVQFRLQFDPAVLQVQDLSLHPDLNLSAVETIDNNTGQVVVVASRRGRVPNLSGDLTLATIQLTAGTNPGQTHLHISDVTAGDRAGTRLTLDSHGLSVSISQ